MLAYTLTIEKLVTVFGYPSVRTRADTLTLLLTVEKLVAVFGHPCVRAGNRALTLTHCMRPAVLSMCLAVLAVFGYPTMRVRATCALGIHPAVVVVHACTVQLVHLPAEERVGSESVNVAQVIQGFDEHALHATACPVARRARQHSGRARRCCTTLTSTGGTWCAG